MKESSIERALVNAVKIKGGKCYKLTGYVGIPDRLVLLPGGIVKFVETKRPGEEPRESQLASHAELRRLGFEVWTLANKEHIEEVLTWMT